MSQFFSTSFVPVSETLIPPSMHPDVKTSSSHSGTGRGRTKTTTTTTFRSCPLSSSKAGDQQACDQFQREWMQGLEPRIEAFLDEAAPHQRGALFERLLRIELANFEAGRTVPILQHYLVRFPQYERVVRLVWDDIRDRLLGTGRPPATVALRSVRLTLVAGPHKGTAFTLPAGSSVVVGRSRSADLALRQDTSISRRHLRLEIGRTQIRVFDLESRNGTLLNGTRVSSAILRDGDTLCIGGTRIIVRPATSEARTSSVR